MFSNVYQLQAGEYLTINMSGAMKKTTWYRVPEEGGALKLSGKAAAERFYELLYDSVRLHLRADVQVGSCLSGGLDSSALVMLMADQLGKTGNGDNLNTVTARFEGTAVDETKYADMVAKAARARSHAARPRAEDILQEVSDVIWHQDEPYGSTSIHAQWHVFARAKEQGLKVMLDGQGADELMAGYHGVYDFHFAQLVRQWRLIAAVALAAQRTQRLGVPFAPQLARGILQAADVAPTAFRVPLRFLAGHAKRALSSSVLHSGPWLREEGFALPDKIPSVWDQAIADAGYPPATDINTLCRSLIGPGNVRTLLHFEDRNSMAHGVEARVPFLDHPLVEFAIGLGSDHKLVNGWTKWVLREAMKNTLPEEVRMRKDKLGFATPESSWMCGPLRSEIAAAVETTVALFPDLFNQKNLLAFTDQVLSGLRPFDNAVWRVACFGIWARKFGVTL
jgi:asparagine synthase (glutamine-hydrolysing)